MIRAYSDLHGILPIIKPCESLLICGDICPVVGSHDPHVQTNYIHGIFTDYCNYLLDEVCQEIVITPGNHDFCFERPFYRELKFPRGVKILIDDDYELKSGFTVWGSPWVPNLKNWAFYADDVALSEYAAIIPEGINIWMMHGPPANVLDRVNGTALHVGNYPIKAHIQSESPSIYVCGHVHEGFGREKLYDTEVMNVSFLDDYYDPMWRHGIVDFYDKLICNLNTRQDDNPKELFWSCRGEVGY